MDQFNRVGVDFLISDAQVALTFLKMAESTKSAEDRSRRIAEAHHAYRTILSLLKRLHPDEQKRPILREELDRLAERLKAMGVSLD